MYILGIESSCDETAVAIYSDNGLLAHQIHSQVDLHAVYGGVVPELASRDHIRKTLPLIQQALCDANLKKSDLEGIAYTRGPGLIGALMVGASIAKSLAYGLDIPALGVHHMESHLMAVFLEDQKPQYPFLALLVSGGHTLLVHIKSLGDYTLLGESVDDAVGEAFDKTAKILGLPYPGGPHLAKLAELGDSNRFHFPRPMLNRPGLNFSFSGLKTHALNTVNKEQCDKQTCADIACAFEEAVVDVLTKKCLRALEQTNVNTLVMVGGVAANKKLRQRLTTTLEQQQRDIFFPRQSFCTDNGAMVAYNGWLRMRAGQRDSGGIEVKTRWSLAELAPPR